jgi:hypothetical protein
LLPVPSKEADFSTGDYNATNNYDTTDYTTTNATDN